MKRTGKEFTTIQQEKVFNTFNKTCFNCGSKALRMEIDHHVPVYHGGINSNDNAVLLCKKCNRIKGGQLPNDFYTFDQLSKLEQVYGVVTFIPDHKPVVEYISDEWDHVELAKLDYKSETIEYDCDTTPEEKQQMREGTYIEPSYESKLTGYDIACRVGFISVIVANLIVFFM